MLSNRVQERRHRKEQDPYQLVISINKSLSLGKTSATTYGSYNVQGTILSTYVSSYLILIATNKAGDIFVPAPHPRNPLVFTAFCQHLPTNACSGGFLLFFQIIPKALLATQPGCRCHLGVTPQLSSL